MRNSDGCGAGCVVALVILVAISALTYGIARVAKTTEYQSVTVTEKTVKNNDGEGKYLIFTKLENGEIKIFEITDSLSRFRWDSSDLYASIEAGKTYKFKVYGFRVPILSDYENIIVAELVTEEVKAPS